MQKPYSRIVLPQNIQDRLSQYGKSTASVKAFSCIILVVAGDTTEAGTSSRGGGERKVSGLLVYPAGTPDGGIPRVESLVTP